MLLKYLVSLLKHKWFVFVECCRLGVPWLGIIHDLSKLFPSEFIPYAQYFYGEYEFDKLSDIPNYLLQCGITTKKEVKRRFDIAWLYHQKRNRHHWQYWILQYDNGEAWSMQEMNIESPKTLAENGMPLLLCETDPPCDDDDIHTKAYAILKRAIELLNRKPVALRMPLRYAKEMLADWRGAGRAYGNPDTRAWYLKNRDKIILHPDTREWIQNQLEIG